MKFEVSLLVESRRPDRPSADRGRYPRHALEYVSISSMMNRFTPCPGFANVPIAAAVIVGILLAPLGRGQTTFSALPVRADAITAEKMFEKARMTGDLATIETLLSAGFNPDMPDRRGQTPLYLALSSNQTSVAELLLRWHADPNAPLKSGRDSGRYPVTPLHFAAQQGNLHMASALI